MKTALALGSRCEETVRITFDYSQLLDQAYLQLGAAREIAESIEVEGYEDIRLDFDEQGQLVGLAFSEADSRVPLGEFSQVSEDPLS